MIIMLLILNCLNSILVIHVTNIFKLKLNTYKKYLFAEYT